MEKFNVKISEVKRGTELQFVDTRQVTLYKNIEKQTLDICIITNLDDDNQCLYLDDIAPQNIHYVLSLFKEAVYKNIVIQLYDKQSGELYDFAFINDNNDIVLCELSRYEMPQSYTMKLSDEEETAVLNYVKQQLEQ